MKKEDCKTTSDEFDRFKKLAKTLFTTPKGEIKKQVGKSKEIKKNTKLK